MAQNKPTDIEQERAAAAEAARIGGRRRPQSDDPALDPVYEAGGGEQEGMEAAERELIANATHDDGRGNPEADAFSPERESDRATSEFAEADDVEPSDQ